ncbi:MAG: transposase [Roseburia sp.]
MALGALIIQTRFQFSDRELVQQITENPYLQYFIGLPGYQETPPFDASTLVLFRERISAKMLMEANEYLLQENNPEKKEEDNDHHNPPSGNGSDDSGKTEETENKGTLTIDATCAPVYIRYPQDVSHLNEAREKLEEMIFWFHKAYGVALPRRDCRAARKQYLSFAKSKKHPAKQIREALKKQLSYVKRNIGYLESFMSEGYAPREKDIVTNEQQQYMYDNMVENQIVSISQPWMRPIVRGKVKAPVEFGAKPDLSIDAKGYARIENISFDAYNESTCLQDAVNAYYERTGYYPERVLADQIYRTRDNRVFFQKHGIRLSGPKLGRPSKETTKTDRVSG